LSAPNGGLWPQPERPAAIIALCRTLINALEPTDRRGDTRYSVD
jgi:hypothetical protein